MAFRIRRPEMSYGHDDLNTVEVISNASSVDSTIRPHHLKKFRGGIPRPPPGESYSKTGVPSTDLDFKSPAEKDRDKARLQQERSNRPFPAVTALVLVFVIYLQILNQTSSFISEYEFQTLFPDANALYQQRRTTLTISNTESMNPTIVRRFGSIIGRSVLWWPFICDSDIHFAVTAAIWVWFAMWIEQNQGAYHLAVLVTTFWLCSALPQKHILQSTELLGFECIVIPLVVWMCFSRLLIDLDAFSDKSGEDRSKLAIEQLGTQWMSMTDLDMMRDEISVELPPSALHMGITHGLLHDMGLPIDERKILTDYRGRVERLERFRMQYREDKSHETRHEKFLRNHRSACCWFFLLTTVYPLLPIMAMECAKRMSPTVGYRPPGLGMKIIFSLVGCLWASLLVCILVRCCGVSAAAELDRKKQGVERDDPLDEQSEEQDPLIGAQKFNEGQDIGGSWLDKGSDSKYNHSRVAIAFMFLVTIGGAVWCTIEGRNAILTRFHQESVEDQFLSSD